MTWNILLINLGDVLHDSHGQNLIIFFHLLSYTQKRVSCRGGLTDQMLFLTMLPWHSKEKDFLKPDDYFLSQSRTCLFSARFVAVIIETVCFLELPNIV